MNDMIKEEECVYNHTLMSELMIDSELNTGHINDEKLC